MHHNHNHKYLFNSLFKKGLSSSDIIAGWFVKWEEIDVKLF